MISEYILRNAKKRRAKIGIGLVNVNEQIISSLLKAKEFTDIIVFGEKVDDINSQIIPKGDNRDSIIIETTVEWYKQGKIDGIVRGNLDAMIAMSVLANKFGYNKILRTTCIRDRSGREFMLTPAAKKEGNSFTERLWMVLESAEFLKKCGIIPKIGVLALRDVRGITDEMDRSIDEAEYIVEKLKEENINAEFAGYAPEVAAKKYNLVVTPNGMIGNYIWRSIVGFGGGVDIGDFGLIKEVFVDDSQYWDDYFQPILFAAAMANLAKE